MESVAKLMERIPRSLWGMAAVVMAVLILWAGSQPGSSIPSLGIRIPHLDKVKHFVVFLLFGALLFRWRYPFDPRQPGAGRWPWLPVVLVPLLVGIADELNQIRVPGRSSDVLDVAADAMGGVVALGLGLLFRAQRRAIVPYRHRNRAL